jgi:plastocyanin
MNNKFTRLFLLLTLAFAFNTQAKTFRIVVWDGYFKFLNHPHDDFNAIEVGDTIVWMPYDKAKTIHTITSGEIPQGAETFDFTYKFPSDTLFSYVVKVPGIYKFKCVPHESMEMIGEFTVQSVVAGMDDKTRLNISLFPNPAMDFLRIENRNNVEFTVSVTDFNGKKIISTTVPGNGGNNIDISGFQSGSYVVQFRGNDIAGSRIFQKK